MEKLEVIEEKEFLKTDESLKPAVVEEKATFGWELILNLYDCNLEVISSKKKIREFADKLCKEIKMKKYGRALIPHFGHSKPHTKGYSLVQFIETSSIIGHFSEYTRSAYINIFSCKRYDAERAKNFTVNFFQAKRVTSHLITRP